METKTDLNIAVGVTSLVMGLLTIFVIYFVIIYRKKQKAFDWERESFKQALLLTKIEIKEQTLSNISRELHDNLGQMASLIKINLNLVLPHLAGENQTKISESLDLLKQLIQDIKSLSVTLKGENLVRFGLLKMIETDLERYQKTGQLSINLKATAEFPNLDTAVEIFLYRMSQEIFNNILKHSQASSADVTISHSNGTLLLEVTDNGVGFEPARVIQGSGLLNLSERCQMIGAELSLDSKPQQGTRISIKLNV